MSHLSSDDLVDALGPEAAAHVSAHLAGCERCRRALDELAATLEMVKGVDVPEPSPLYWSHLTSGVSRAVASEPPTSTAVPWGRIWSARSSWTVAAAAVVIVAIAGAVVFGPGRAPRPRTERQMSGDSPADSAPATVEPDVPWAFIADAGGGVDWDVISTAVLDPSPGSVENEVLQLSDAERRELVRLLQAELAGSAL